MGQPKQGKVKKRKRQAGRRKQQPVPGWIWLLVGLGIGLLVAGGIYVSDRRPPVTDADRPAKAAVESQVSEQSDASMEPDPAARFSFYELLPKFEVVIPEEDLNAVPDNRAAAVMVPGVYVLQAGSFSSFADADRMKAGLALLGIVSHIQKVTVDDKTYHRVRVGPVDQLGQLNMLRKQLRDAKIEALVIQVGE
jgi:cell division protein FtsN